MTNKNPYAVNQKRLSIYTGYKQSGQDLIDRIKAYALSHNQSVNQVLLEAINRFLDDKK